MDLARLDIVPPLPRRRLDAGALPQLRSPHGGFRRLPLPGFPAGWRCYGHGSGVLVGAIAWHRRIGGAGSEFRRGRGAGCACDIIRTAAEADSGSLELPHESQIDQPCEEPLNCSQKLFTSEVAKNSREVRKEDQELFQLRRL